jgi:dTDP-4-dehydrorhamnose reductase
LSRTGAGAPRHLSHDRRGEASWADLAEAIFAISAECGGPSARVRRISTADYPTSAARPANSRMDATRLHQSYGLRLPDWRASIVTTVTRLVKQKEALA